VRFCMGRKNSAGLALILIGFILLAFSLPVKFWLALIGTALIVSGVLILKEG